MPRRSRSWRPGVGLLVVALEIAYLPALYNAFATRETEVTLLATRSGTPAWGPEILARHYMLGNIDELPPLYADWERWAAAVSESHANYPALIWFRSPVSDPELAPQPGGHDGLGRAVPRRQPATDASAGSALPLHGHQLPAFHGPRPARSPTTPTRSPPPGSRLTREEFVDGYRRLEEVDFPLERDLEESWRHFQGWRVNYESIVDSLTRLILPPPAPVVPGAARHGCGRVARCAQPDARTTPRALSVLGRARP